MRLTLLLVTLCVPFATAQPAEERSTPLEDGARALVFSVGQGADLDGFDNANLGIKWHTSEARALRLSLSAGATVSAQFGTLDTNQQVAYLGVTLVPLHYRRSRTPIYLYTGIGPTVQVQATRFGAEGQNGGQWSSLVEVGAAGVVGVEWIVAEAIGLTGEYSHALTVGGRFASEEEIRISFVPRGVQFGVAVYF